MAQSAAVGGDDGHRNAVDLHEIHLAVATSHQLGCGIADTADINGEDAHGARGNGEPGQLHSAGLEPDILLGGEALQTLVVVDKDKGTTTLPAHGPPQLVVVALLEVLRRRERGFHWSQLRRIIVHEEMEGTQHVVVRIGLAKLAQWCLEVVGAHGQVVVGGAR